MEKALGKTFTISFATFMYIPDTQGRPEILRLYQSLNGGSSINPALAPFLHRLFHYHASNHCLQGLPRNPNLPVDDGTNGQLSKILLGHAYDAEYFKKTVTAWNWLTWRGQWRDEIRKSSANGFACMRNPQHSQKENLFYTAPQNLCPFVVLPLK